LFEIQNVTGSLSIGSGSSSSFTKTIEKNGYIPLGIVNLFQNGSSDLIPYSYGVGVNDSGNAYVRVSIANKGNSALTASLDIDILWQKVLHV